ncbi:cation acetate symporter [Prosthecobacter sp.]|uniref:cation acetate symporter n=1 Tax=Prosthecobacter sp. TaxID=1965333 RepID=UPI003782DF26
MNIPLIMFLAFVGLTLLITFWAAKKNTGASAYFAAGRSITGWQNGLAVAGDYMSAASFLGISGMICFYGYDGFMYSVGFLVAYITVLLVVAEPLRNAGKYTMADLLAYRLKPRPVRALASLSTLTVSTFYMIAQMVGAGVIIQRLIGLPFAPAVIGVGMLMLVYVVFGGMLATTWVQIIKALLLIAGAMLLSYLVLQYHHFSFAEFFSAVSKADYAGTAEPKNLMEPGLKFGVAVAGPWGPLDLISLGLGLVLGTAGLPHILVRFYTVPDAKTARSSVVWAMAIIGLFYIMTTFFGFGAATILKKALITTAAGKPDTNMVAPILAQVLGGEFFFAFISAVAFATILAVVAGLTMSASASFAHDFYSNVIHHGKTNRPGMEVKVARITAFCVGAVSISIAIYLGPSVNAAFLVGLAFAVAASANLPVIIFSVFWKRFNTTGAVAGLSVGLISSIVLILLSPNGIFGKEGAIFPLENPGIVSIPIGFIAAWLGTILTARDPEAEAKFAELTVRAHTGLGAEKATSH